MKALTDRKKPSGVTGFLKSDASVAAIFFIVGILSRVPFRSRLLYHWDSVNFALGMEQFDVRLHQPHPPGYLLYVLCARLVNLLVDDANASLVWLSVLFGALTISTVYMLGRRLFGQGVATVSALLTLTSPAFWFYSEVALTYAVEAFFVTAIAWACLEALRGNRWAALLSAVLLGLAGGVRQTTIVLMLPLWLFSLRRCHWCVRLCAVVLLSLTVVAWFAPTIIVSGGLGSYLEASRSVSGLLVSGFELFGGGSLLLRLSPFIRLTVYLMYGLMLGALPLLYGFARVVSNPRGWLKQWLRDDRAHVMLLWLAPNVLLYAPLARVAGHTFSFMPALVLLAGAATLMLGQSLAGRFSVPTARVGGAIAGSIAAVNIVFFLAAPAYLFDIRRVVTTTPSWPTVRYRDRYLSERVSYITQHFDAATTVVVTAGPDYRHPDYYLRDYHSLIHEPDQPVDGLLPGSQILVLFSDTLSSQREDVRTITMPSEEKLVCLQLDGNLQVYLEENLDGPSVYRGDN